MSRLAYGLWLGKSSGPPGDLCGLLLPRHGLGIDQHDGKAGAFDGLDANVLRGAQETESSLLRAVARDERLPVPRAVLLSIERATTKLHVRTYLKPALGSLRIANLRKEHVRKALADWSQRTAYPGKKSKTPVQKISPRTVHHVFLTLRTAMHDTLDDGAISVVPFAKRMSREGPRRDLRARRDADRGAAELSRRNAARACNAARDLHRYAPR